MLDHYQNHRIKNLLLHVKDKVVIQIYFPIFIGLHRKMKKLIQCKSYFLKGNLNFELDF